MQNIMCFTVLDNTKISDTTNSYFYVYSMVKKTPKGVFLFEQILILRRLSNNFVYF